MGEITTPHTGDDHLLYANFDLLLSSKVGKKVDMKILPLIDEYPASVIMQGIPESEYRRQIQISDCGGKGNLVLQMISSSTPMTSKLEILVCIVYHLYT